MTNEEIIAVVKAHSEGKKIEFRHKVKVDAKWVDTSPNPKWNFEHTNYRIKPEPLREEWLAYPNNGDSKSCCWFPKEQLHLVSTAPVAGKRAGIAGWADYTFIKMREVRDEEVTTK